MYLLLTLISFSYYDKIIQHGKYRILPPFSAFSGIKCQSAIDPPVAIVTAPIQFRHYPSSINVEKSINDTFNSLNKISTGIFFELPGYPIVINPTNGTIYYNIRYSCVIDESGISQADQIRMYYSIGTFLVYFIAFLFVCCRMRRSIRRRIVFNFFLYFCGFLTLLISDILKTNETSLHQRYPLSFQLGILSDSFFFIYRMHTMSLIFTLITYPPIIHRDLKYTFISPIFTIILFLFELIYTLFYIHLFPYLEAETIRNKAYLSWILNVIDDSSIYFYTVISVCAAIIILVIIQACIYTKRFKWIPRKFKNTLNTICIFFSVVIILAIVFVTRWSVIGMISGGLDMGNRLFIDLFDWAMGIFMLYLCKIYQTFYVRILNIIIRRRNRRMTANERRDQNNQDNQNEEQNQPLNPSYTLNYLSLNSQSINENQDFEDEKINPEYCREYYNDDLGEEPLLARNTEYKTVF